MCTRSYSCTVHPRLLSRAANLPPHMHTAFVNMNSFHPPDLRVSPRISCTVVLQASLFQPFVPFPSLQNLFSCYLPFVPPSKFLFCSCTPFIVFRVSTYRCPCWCVSIRADNMLYQCHSFYVFTSCRCLLTRSLFDHF